ncbi:hypothetical protein HK099_005267 [Clydaea vesicula]|uniref:Splicing factor 3B subunit 4 n=1 Tax=Clydaea vesicula TaxID=447962 RepID=A0AAD5U6I8_9FUNG|nr:hypothetical protein HK099_005267 [Clydaea vesicula]
MTMVKLFGKPIRVNKATSDKKEMDIGATLFIGNLDPDVDEKLLYDTFSAFGVLISTPKVGRDVEAGVSKGFGFICYDNFENADHAIEAMNGQYLANKVITVSYAFKKDERLLAAQAKKNLPQVNRNANFQPIPPPSAYQQRVPPPNVGGFTPQFPQQSGFPPQIGFPPHIGFPLQGNFNPPY